MSGDNKEHGVDAIEQPSGWKQTVEMWQLYLSVLVMLCTVVGPVVTYGLGLGARMQRVEDWQVAHERVQIDQQQRTQEVLMINRSRLDEIQSRQIDVITRLGRIEGKLDARGK
jgi:hypothetical protein